MRALREDYRQGEKPPRSQQLIDLAKLHGELQAQMAALAAESGEPIVIDLSAASPEALRSEWKSLEQARGERARWVGGRRKNDASGSSPPS